MPDRPNLFQYAVSELAQDAFICWLLAWADHGNDTFDAGLHKAGLRALNDLLKLHGESSAHGDRVAIRRQVKNVDIVVEVGNDLILMIEDKVDAAEDGNDLRGYTAAIMGEYPGRKVLPVYLKTGDQCSYKAVIDADYKLFLRKDVLSVLRAGKEQDSVSNAVFLDFLEHIEARDRAVEAFAHSAPEEWDHYAWVGFYMKLQNAIPELHWTYVPNGAGGFRSADWHYRDWKGWKVYIQIEQQRLCLKLHEHGPYDEPVNRAKMRDQWLEKLKTASTGRRLKIMRKKWLGVGWSMTAGWLEGDEWLVTGPDGNVDMPRILALLHEAEAIVDDALGIAD